MTCDDEINCLASMAWFASGANARIMQDQITATHVKLILLRIHFLKPMGDLVPCFYDIK